jgi:hypothetical protein
MYGNALPKTGIASIAIGAGGATVNAPLPLVIAAIGLGIVTAGVVLVRVGFRRRKGVGQA